jgi:quinoprotein glucose dehydrogenase
MEMFYSGLRNPQDLVFDEWGNLFTGDNNSDGGDQSRWTYLLEGGDSGWRIGWQFLERPNARGPWNSERMWAPQNEAHPAYLTPPIKNIAAGPSGVSYYPGTGLTDDWQGTFTLADFRGSSAGSGLWKFKLKPKGASFELVENEERFIWSVNVTDGHWGPDGAFWLLDWYDGWEPQGKGRIYRFYHPDTINNPVVQTTQRLLREGFAQRNELSLVALLGHPNYRVRQGAQFELAARGERVMNALVRVAQSGPNLHARLHAIWALGQVADALHATRQGASSPALETLLPLARDPDSRVRSNVARVLGNAKYRPAYDVLTALTADSDLHTRALGTIALGKLGRRESVPALLSVLRTNADRDAHLRHAAVLALSMTADADDLFPLVNHESEAVRMGALLTFRHWGRNEISRFLSDPSRRIVTEAARAINDLPIPGAMPELASLIGNVSGEDALVRRVVNANYRFGTADTARALAQFASASNASEAIRAEALDALASWPKNSGRDRITGLWRPTAFARDERVPSSALSEELESLLGNVPNREIPNRVRAAAARAAGELGAREAAPMLARILTQQEADGATRVAALNALAKLDAEELDTVLEQATEDPDEEVRKTATRLLAGEASTEVRTGRRGRRAERSDDTSALVRRLTEVIEKGSLSERQNALATLAGLSGPGADAALGVWMQQLVAGEAPKELALDIYEAAAKRPALEEWVKKYDTTLDKADDLGPYRLTLHGGSVAEGRKIFIERVEVSCVRCHRAEGEGGEVGPPMDGLVANRDREYLLRSIVHPNADIAEGYDNMLIILKNDDLYAGVIHSENEKELVLNSPEDGFVTIQIADIEEREKGLSGMPDGFGEILSKRDLRDLVEYLASLR